MRAPGVGGDEFLASALRQLRGASTRSSGLARAFYDQARRLDAPAAAPAFSAEPESFDEEATTASLVAAGFAFLNDELERGLDLAEALENAGRSVTAAGVRRSQAAGRGTIIGAVERDKVALAYYWQTRGDAQVCSWCGMLESRGPVFKDGSWKTEEDPRPDGFRKVSAHDDCRCWLAPTFRRGQALPDVVEQRYSDWKLVRDATGASGHEALLAWRRWWEALQRGESSEMALARARRDMDAVARLRQAAA